MRRNVTVVLDEDTARWVRVEAAKNDVSVSQFLGELLEERRRANDGYERARERFMARPARALRSAGEPLPKRSDLHR